VISILDRKNLVLFIYKSVAYDSYAVFLCIVVHSSWGEILLEYLKKENAISAKGAMKLWEVSGRTTRIRLKQLQEEGIIVRIGTSENDPSASYIAARRSS
jgi:predicted HTH transcriptional regulator